MGFLVIPTESRAQELAASLFEGNLGKSQEQEMAKKAKGKNVWVKLKQSTGVIMLWKRFLYF